MRTDAKSSRCGCYYTVSAAASLSFCISSRLPLAYHSRVASARSHLPPIDNKGLASRLCLSETQQLPTSSRTTTALHCALLLTFLDGSFAANDPWETRCNWEIVDSMNSTNTIRILIRPVAFLVC